MATSPGGIRHLVARLFGIEAEEVPAVVAGMAMFLLLFAGYFMLRPVRETMGIAGGVLGPLLGLQIGRAHV